MPTWVSELLLLPYSLSHPQFCVPPSLNWTMVRSLTITHMTHMIAPILRPNSHATLAMFSPLVLNIVLNAVILMVSGQGQL